MDIVIVAAKKEIVNSYLEAATAAGQNVEIVGCGPVLFWKHYMKLITNTTMKKSLF